MSVFEINGGSLDPISVDDQFAGYGPFGGANFRVFRRCPGGQTQPAADGSTPFLDGGLLTSPAPPGDCSRSRRPPGTVTS